LPTSDKKGILKKAYARLEESILDDWIGYNLFVMAWAVLILPFLSWLEKGLIFYLAAATYSLLVILYFPSKYIVAERDPHNFIRGEKLKGFASRAYWILLFFALGCVCALVVADKLNMQETIPTILSVFSWVIFFFTGTTLYITSVAATSKQATLLRVRSRAFLRVVSQSFAKDSRKEHKKGLSLFKKGFKNYNDYLKREFGFAIRQPMRYCNYLKLVVNAEDDGEIERIRGALDRLANLLLKKDSKLLDVLQATKGILGETLSDVRAAYSDIEFEVGLRKWLSTHKDNIKLVIMLASLIVSWLTLITRFM